MFHNNLIYSIILFKGSSGAYDSHRKKKHFWGNFRCPACSFRCHFAQELVDHMQQGRNSIA